MSDKLDLQSPGLVTGNIQKIEALFPNCIDWGLPLSCRIEELQIDGKHVFRVAQNSLMTWFDNGINEAFAKEPATHTPLCVVFRDRSFANDTAKENVKQLLKQLSPETEMRFI